MNVIIKQSIEVAGSIIRAERTLSPDNVISSQETINAGRAGTAGAAGIMTLGSGHGITDAVKVAIKWATGFIYDCTVNQYDSTTITVTGGTGDALPTSGAVVVSVKQQIDAAFLGTNLDSLAIGSDIDAFITMESSVPAVHLAKAIGEDDAYTWDSGNGETNPITGDSIVSLNVYNKTAVAGNLSAFIGYNND